MFDLEVVRRRNVGFFTLLLLWVVSATVLFAQVQPADEEFARLVREWTTQPEFMSPLVDHLPKVAGIPSPRDLLGYYIGAPKKLTYYGRILQYYRALAGKSPRVKVLPIGTTDEGRECVVVFVGSAESIENLEQYRSYLGRLADPRNLSAEKAQEIISQAKPIYHLIGGLHSAETGPPEMLMELTYRLATEDSPLIQKIRKNLIVSLTPVAEPDGRDRYVDWYYRYNVDQTDERERVSGPPYWGKYVLHDNNRDINYSQVTMRTLLDWYLQWHPPIMHELHESVPFLYSFSGQAPQNPNLDPILYGELPWFSNFEMAQMTKYGMPGVWTHAFVDMWSPGYLGFMASNHNGLFRMYETFGNGGATTMKRKIERPNQRTGGGRTTPTSREWYRPLPPYKTVVWSMRNNTNYMETGVLSALELAAAFPEIILENFYRKSRNSIESGKTEPPFGYVIPSGQRDMTRVALVVNILRMQGIEVGQAPSEFVIGEVTFPAGSYIVKLDQPYGRLAKILLEKQEYPDPKLRTYDSSAWTLGLMTQTDIREIKDKAILSTTADEVTEARIVGRITGAETARAYVVRQNGSTNLITFRNRMGDIRILAADKSFETEDETFPAGSLIIPVEQANTDLHRKIRSDIAQLGLSAAALASIPAVDSRELQSPRLAVYSTWGSTQEVGWVRHAFDHFEVPYELIYKERVGAGKLLSAFDIIVIPNQGRTAKGLVFGIAPKGKPIAYTRNERFKNLGMYGESKDITGGMGLAGALELERFVRGGGLLITLGAASFFPPDFGITRNINARRPSSQFYAPGPIVNAEILHEEHPLFYGYAKKIIPVRYANGPLLQVPEKDRDRQVLMRFPGTKDDVLSGLMRGAGQIKKRPAIVEVPVDQGRVLLFATNPCYRWQNHGEFNMLFNALMYTSAPREESKTSN